MRLIKKFTAHVAMALSIALAVIWIVNYYNPTMAFASNNIFYGMTYALIALSFVNAVILIVQTTKEDIKKRTGETVKTLEHVEKNTVDSLSILSKEDKFKIFMEEQMEINNLIKETYEQLGFEYPGEPGSYKAPETIEKKDIAKYIDHTILKSECDYDAVKKICDEAKQYGFASVCVNPSYISYVAKELEGSSVCPCCVIGFPFGTQTPEAKAFEAADAVKNGAKEVDMVINVGAVKNGEWNLSYKDINEVVKAIDGKAALKVIIETCLLTDEEKVKICTIAKLAGAQFVKTSTGFSKGGATPEDVALMRATVGAEMGVKASGGIRSYEDAVKMIKAGASRLGCSAGVAIVS